MDPEGAPLSPERHGGWIPSFSRGRGRKTKTTAVALGATAVDGSTSGAEWQRKGVVAKRATVRPCLSRCRCVDCGSRGVFGPPAVGQQRGRANAGRRVAPTAFWLRLLVAADTFIGNQRVGLR